MRNISCLALLSVFLALPMAAEARGKPSRGGGGTSGVVNTNCGPLCGGGMVCIVRQSDGSYLTTTATPPAGRRVTLDTSRWCWLLLP